MTRGSTVPRVRTPPRINSSPRRSHGDHTAITTVHQPSRGTYGSPRIHADLWAQGVSCSVRRVARLMQATGLTGSRRRRGAHRTTDSRHTHPIAANGLQRQLAVATVAQPTAVWASDLTYIPPQEGWLYLAVVLDLASRRVIGWAMRHTRERGLTLDALTMALAQRQPTPGGLHHSDRGRPIRGRRLPRTRGHPGDDVQHE